MQAPKSVGSCNISATPGEKEVMCKINKRMKYGKQFAFHLK